MKNTSFNTFCLVVVFLKRSSEVFISVSPSQGGDWWPSVIANRSSLESKRKLAQQNAGILGSTLLLPASLAA